MKCRFTLITLLLFKTCFAHANTEVDVAQCLTPTQGDSIKLVGKGIENRRTGEMIALTCVGQPSPGSTEASCGLLQHLYWSSKTAIPQVIGNVIKVAGAEDASDQQEVKAAIRKLSRDYKKYKWVNGDGINRFGHVLIFGGGGGPLILACRMIMLGIAGTPATVIPLVAVGVVAITGLLLEDKIGAIGKSRLVYVLKDQDGWNWAEKTKKVRRTSFETYHEWVLQEKIQ